MSLLWLYNFLFFLGLYQRISSADMLGIPTFFSSILVEGIEQVSLEVKF